MSEVRPLFREEVRKEGADALRRYSAVLPIVEKAASQTPLSMDRAWRESDIEVLKEMMIQSARFAHPRAFPSLWVHSQITSEYAFELTCQLNPKGLSPLEAKALGLTHDFGKIIAPHLYLRDNQIADRMFSRAGARREVMSKLPPIPRILRIGENPILSIDDFSEAQMLLDVADNIGKQNADGEMFSIQQMLDYIRKRPAFYAGKSDWSGVNTGRNAMEALKGANLDLLEAEIMWLAEKKGVARGNIEGALGYFDDVKSIVEARVENEESKKWLSNMVNAQETLDPEVDKKLGRSPIQTIVWDIGSVLLNDTDPILVDRLSKAFGVTESFVNEVWSEYNPASMRGEVSETEYLKLCWKKFGKECPVDINEARKPFVHPEVYTPILGMPELVVKLAETGIDQWVLSDAIEVLVSPIQQFLETYFPQLPQEQRFISALIKNSKRDNGAPALKYLKDKIGNVDPSSILFIDDKANYTAAARGIHGIRGFTFIGNLDRGESPVQRLTRELHLAGILG